MTPEDRRNWQHFHDRGLRDFLTRAVAYMFVVTYLGFFIATFVTPLGNGLSIGMKLLIFLIPSCLFAIPFGLFCGWSIWLQMEKRFDESKGYQPTKEETKKRKIFDRKVSIIALPIFIGAFSVFFPDPFKMSFFIGLGLSSLLIVYFGIRENSWHSRRRGRLPLNDSTSIFEIAILIIAGMFLIVLGLSPIFAN